MTGRRASGTIAVSRPPGGASEEHFEAPGRVNGRPLRGRSAGEGQPMGGPAVAVVTTRQLLEAGMHFGHQTRRWNPKMRRFILGERNGIYIIDLKKTLEGLEEAYGYVRDLVANGGILLFVGTKKQTQGPIATYAAACGMPYVNERWLGGMLTNFATISSRVGKMREYEAMERAGDFEGMPKKEGLRFRRELEKLRRNLGGIRDLDRLPDAVFVIDTKKEHIAVTEGRWVAEHRPRPPAPPATAPASGSRRPPRGPRAPIGSDTPEPPAAPE